MSTDDRRCLCVNEAGQQRCPIHSHLLPRDPLWSARTYPAVVGDDGPAQRPLGKYEQRGLFVGQKTDEKNQKYGDAFHKCGDFLRLLYPDGVRPDQYQDMLAVVRIFDKQMRIATDKDALGEDPFADIAGYGLLGMKP